MKQLKEWVCSSGCDLSTGVICPHLESLLPSAFDGDSPQLASEGQVSNMTISVFDKQFWKHDEESFLGLMRNYGVTDEWDLDLLSAKYYRNLSADDIVKEFNYVRRDTVYRRLKALRALLKERGIEQELLSWQPNQES